MSGTGELVVGADALIDHDFLTNLGSVKDGGDEGELDEGELLGTSSSGEGHSLGCGKHSGSPLLKEEEEWVKKTKWGRGRR